MFLIKKIMLKSQIKGTKGMLHRDYYMKSAHNVINLIMEFDFKHSGSKYKYIPHNFAR